MQKMIDIFKPHSIKSFIRTAKKDRAQLKLWQTISRTKDYHLGIIEHIDPISNAITFRVPKCQKLEFRKSDELYFHSPYRDLIFKAEIREIERNCVTITFPNLIKFQEARTEKRTYLGLQSYHFAKVTMLNKFRERVDAKLKVLDFSSKGLALIVNKYLFESLNVDDKIVIRETSVNGEIKNRIFIIRNVGNVTNKIGHTNEFRIGLELCA